MKVFLLFLIITMSVSAEIKNMIQINDNQNSSAQKSPSITSDDEGTIYSICIDYRKNNLGEIYFTKSSDNGKTWSENKFIFKSDIPNSKFQRYATIKNHGDNLYVCWMTTISAKIDIFFCKSTDKGETFSNPVIVSDDNSKYNQDFPVMNVDDNGGIHITAIDNRNLEQGKVKFAELMYTHSTDEGETWSANKIISNLNSEAGACECCWPSVDTYTDKEGKVTVSILYRSNINNLRVSYLANSYDGGLNFELPIRVGFADWIVASCPVSGPSIIYDKSGVLHMTYKTISEVYYSTFDYRNPKNNELLIGKGENPGIVYDENASMTYVTYENFENNRLLTKIVGINDNKKMTNSDFLLNEDTELNMFNLKMINSVNKIYLVWEDESEGHNQNNIWFAEYISTLSNIESSYEKPSIRTIDNVDILVTTKEGNTKIIISDLLGRVVYEQELNLPVIDYRINLSNYNAKVYICNIMSENLNESKLIIN